MSNVAPILLMIGGLVLFVSLKVYDALSPGRLGDYGSDEVLAGEIIVAFTAPYFIVLFLERKKQSSFLQRALNVAIVLGTTISLGVVIKALFLKQPMLPILIDFINDELYWMVPTALLSALLGTRSSRSGAGSS